MKLIVGLGNPEEKYDNTRHNAGFKFVESVNLKSQISNFKLEKKFNAVVADLGDVMLVKPMTYMNRSGEAVRKFMAFYKIKLDDLCVVHDDLDIILGTFKLQRARGPKVHNGVNSVESALGSKDFWRIRLGVDNRRQEIQNSKSQIRNNVQNSNEQNSKQYISGQQYVLMKMNEEEERILDGAIDEAIARLRMLWGLV